MILLWPQDCSPQKHSSRSLMLTLPHSEWKIWLWNDCFEESGWIHVIFLPDNFLDCWLCFQKFYFISFSFDITRSTWFSDSKNNIFYYKILRTDLIHIINHHKVTIRCVRKRQTHTCAHTHTEYLLRFKKSLCLIIYNV